MLRYYNFDIVFQEIPDEVTLAINLTCCPNRCKGCHSPHLRQKIGPELTTSELDSIILRYKNEITCVCFMGGDNDVEAIGQQHKKGSKKPAWPLRFDAAGYF